MLTGISVSMEGGKVLIEDLERYSVAIKEKAMPGALSIVAEGIAKEAQKLLRGPKRGVKTVIAKKSGRQRAVGRNPQLAGGYPVPRMAGNLLHLMDWLKPNHSKGAFSTGPFEAVVFNSAEYARVIHQGTGSSAKFGERPFLDDAVMAFNESVGIKKVFEEKIAEVRSENGLG